MVLSKVNKITESEMLLSNDTEKIEMDIDMNAISHIISRLTQLYENPIYATVRELVSNAFDATNKLPKNEQKAVDILAPTLLKKEFVVQDFGEGMSKEIIKNVYSKYGGSTKQTDMSQIGAYGLGAKAPLSYCSQFIVESVHEGMLTELLVSSEADGNYTRIIRHVETEKPNGTKVVIPVREEDIYEFEIAIKQYNKFSKRNDVNIIGVEKSKTDQMFYVGKLPVDTTETGEVVYVDVYNESNDLSTLFLQFLEMNKTKKYQIDFVLSGWVYRNPFKKSRSQNDFYIDLVPGLVNFSSSRDNITKDSRCENLLKKIEEQLFDLVLSFMKEQYKTNQITKEKLLTIFAQFHKIEIQNVWKRNSNEFIEKYEMMFDSIINEPNFNFYKFVNDSKDIFSFCLSKSKNWHNKLVSKLLEVTMETNGRKKYSMTNRPLKDIRTEIDKDDNVKFGLAGLFMYNDYHNLKNVIITDVHDDDTKKILNRATSYYNNVQPLKEQVNMYVTELKKNEFENELKSVIDDIDNFEIITFDEFIELTKVVRAKSTTKTKKEKSPSFITASVFPFCSLIDSSSYISSILEFNEHKYEINLESDEYWDESKDNKKETILLIVPAVSTILLRKEVLKLLFNEINEKETLNIDLYIIPVTKLRIKDLELISKRFNKIVKMDGTNHSSDKINNFLDEIKYTLDQQNSLSNDKIYFNLEKGSYLNKLYDYGSLASAMLQKYSFFDFIEHVSEYYKKENPEIDFDKLLSNEFVSLKDIYNYMNRTFIFFETNEADYKPEDNERQAQIFNDKTFLELANKVDTFNKENDFLFRRLSFRYYHLGLDELTGIFKLILKEISNFMADDKLNEALKEILNLDIFKVDTL